MSVKQLRSGWDAELLVVSSGSKLFVYGTLVVLGGLRVKWTFYVQLNITFHMLGVVIWCKYKTHTKNGQRNTEHTPTLKQNAYTATTLTLPHTAPMTCLLVKKVDYKYHIHKAKLKIGVQFNLKYNFKHTFMSIGIILSEPLWTRSFIAFPRLVYCICKQWLRI